MRTHAWALIGWVFLAGCREVPARAQWTQPTGGTIVFTLEGSTLHLPNDEGPTWTDDRLHDREQLSPDASTKLLAVALWLPVVTVLSLALMRRRRHLAAAAREQRWSPDAPLTPGLRAVFGTVVAPALVPVARASLFERKRSGKGGFIWKEQRREVTASPFALTLHDGRTVHVEPGARVEVRHPLRTAGAETAERVRVAEITGGAAVHVYGELTIDAGETGVGEYRTAPPRLVLRAPGREAMVISTIEPAVAHAEVARRASRIARFALGLFVVCQLGMFGDWTLLSLAGTTHTARITHVTHWTIQQKYGVAPQSGVRVASADGVTAECATSEPFAACVEGMRCRSVRVRTAPGGLATLGERPTYGFLRLAIAIALMFVAWVFGLLADVAQPVSWYVRRGIIEEN